MVATPTNGEIERLEKRLAALEGRVSSLEGKTASQPSKASHTKADEHLDLSGGIRLLVEGGFLDTPKSRKDVFEELKRLGYFHRKEAVSTALSRDWMKRKRILTRVPTVDGKGWLYVKKK